MKIVFHKDFHHTDYASNGASAPGRMEAVMTALVEEGHYEIVSPQRASNEDLARAHCQAHIADVARNTRLFEMASLAAGGAIAAAEIALKGEAAFACIRPPGHHASRDGSWGYCALCNMGIALLKLKEQGLIESAFVLDFDAHTGDGNIDVLSTWQNAVILNPMAENNKEYLRIVEEHASNTHHVDMVAASAGFDSYEKDLGKTLTTFDFYVIGRLLKQLAKRMGHHRRFAVLEGGYYLPDLGKNALAFCQGFE